ncbi:DUF2499 domain-containing protein [Caldichromatium japonicum]|uniref:DUF2499 domain-containing protein n=1 Tax=Caldichromatium japonicum TaxID=2699430 RepID=A0A6G7VG08_9GAMM|nr:DUF2499 domain-containing protein [Caldichromatium japonicum]QIK39013.1 DUF2499 domain-containing protein [Caldichromatium japonicum]
MLLSWPTWIIHLLTVSEWALALLFFWRYGRLIQRSELQRFAFAMTPHLAAGLAILGFHLSGDTWHVLLEGARALNLLGSLLLLAATSTMLPTLRPLRPWLWSIVPLGVVWALVVHWPPVGEEGLKILRLANLAYLLFLISLLAVYRADQRLFSPLSIAGFCFLLVFVAVTIAATHLATARWGLPSLSHADPLHGFSESFLSVANLLVAWGAYRRLKEAQIRA